MVSPPILTWLQQVEWASLDPESYSQHTQLDSKIVVLPSSYSISIPPYILWLSLWYTNFLFPRLEMVICPHLLQGRFEMSFEHESQYINCWLPGKSKKKGLSIIISLPHICEKQQVPKVLVCIWLSDTMQWH